MDKFVRPVRVAVIFVIIIIFITVYVSALYELQIINGADYYEESRNTIVTTSTVTASRGEILDRYGRVLVSNRSSNNVTIDKKALLASGDPNGVILKIISAAKKQGVSHNDSLPVSLSTPYTYAANLTSSQEYRLARYIEYFELDTELSATELMDFLREHYGISRATTTADARLIIGVRYELEIREIVYTSDYIFAEDISIDLISVIKEQDFPGIEITVASVREYHTTYAAHILGRVGLMDGDEVEYYSTLGYPMNATVGKEGVEKAFESYLKGEDGTLTTTTNSAGSVTGVLTTQEAAPGGNVILTIDIGLQAAAENSLAAHIAEINEGRGEDAQLAEGGAAVVIDVNSGEILAIASYPSYDRSTFSADYNDLAADELRPMLNRAVLGTYSPGSTYKMVTAIAALEEGTITASTRIRDRGIFTEYDSYQPKCWVYPSNHGNINVVEALGVSCNYFFYTVGNQLGIKYIAEYAGQFGFGQETGIEIGEETGILASREYKEEVLNISWYVGDTLQAAMGQSYNQFTPLQIASYVAIIANGGTRYSAHLMKSVKSYDYSAITYTKGSEVLGTVNASKENFGIIRQGMRAVTRAGGTGADTFKNYPIEVAAKTGTVELGNDSQTNSVFVAYAPYDNPEIAIAVVVEKGGHGAEIAGIAKDILDYYFSFDEVLDQASRDNGLIR